MGTFYEISILLLGDLPESMSFLYSMMTFILTLMTVSSCIALILIPMKFFRG